MKRLLGFLPLIALVLAGCSAIEMPGTARYFSNQPGGLPFFKVSSGLGGPTLAVRKMDGKWTKPHLMKTLSPTDPPMATTPGLAAMVDSAHRVDDYVFIEFKKDAKVHGQPVPSMFFLLPGGFAYLVTAPGS